MGSRRTEHDGLEDAPLSRPGYYGGNGTGELIGGASRTGHPPLKEHLLTLRRRWWLLLAGGLAGLGAGVFLAPSVEPTYTAAAVLHLTNARRTLAGNLESSVTPVTDEIASQVQIITSRGLAEEVVRTTGLRLQVLGIGRARFADVHVAEDASADTIVLSFTQADVTAVRGVQTVSASYGEPLDLGDISFKVVSRPQRDRAELVVISLDAAIERVRGGLGAYQREKTNLINIRYSSADRHTAQQIADAVAAAFVAWGTRTDQAKATQRRAFVDEQLKQTDSLVSEAQMALGEFRQRARLYNAGQRFAAQQGMLLDLDVRREEMITERRAIDSLLTRIRRSPETLGQDLQVLVAWPGLTTNPLIGSLVDRLIGFDAERESKVTAGRARSNPDVLQLDTLIQSTRAKLIEAVANHVGALDARIAVLETLKNHTSDRLSDLPQAEATEVRLAQRLETLGEIASLLRQELHRARIAEAVQEPHAEVIDRAAVIGVGRGSPRRSMIMGLLAGLFLGAFGAFVIEALDTSIRREDEIEGLLNARGLGVVPRLTADERMYQRLKRALPRSKREAGRTNGNGAATLWSGEGPAAAEAFRILRTNLMLSSDAMPRIVVITSTEEAAGKTTTAVNLAAAFAEQALKVLLVDCDLRRPRLHRYYGVAVAPGFKELVEGECPAHEAIRGTASPFLSVLPAGGETDKPTPIVSSPRARALFDVMSSSYDLIIIDTPPVLYTADAMVVSAFSDGVLLVVRAGETDRTASILAIQRLNQVGADVVGVVLNDPDGRVPAYGSYAYE